jgi:hypothetical protein
MRMTGFAFIIFGTSLLAHLIIDKTWDFLKGPIKSDHESEK